MGYSGAGRKLIHEKSWSRKFRGRRPLIKSTVYGQNSTMVLDVLIYTKFLIHFTISACEGVPVQPSDRHHNINYTSYNFLVNHSTANNNNTELCQQQQQQQQQQPCLEWTYGRQDGHKARKLHLGSPFTKFMYMFTENGHPLKKLSLAGLAKLSRLKYSWLWFGLASAG